MCGDFKIHIGILAAIFVLLFTQHSFAASFEKNRFEPGPAQRVAVKMPVPVAFNAITKVIPYTQYFTNMALNATTDFQGLTRSFQLYLDPPGTNPSAEDLIEHGAVAYDQSLLSRIGLLYGSTTILDTYTSYATPAQLADPNNPLINCNGNYYGATGNPINHGLYRVVRILGNDSSHPLWWNSWDWIVDTGATACFIVDALEAFLKTNDTKYLNFAVLLGDYLRALQDTDGGIRYGPRGIAHAQGTDFFWKLKSTEQNERCLYAFEALSSVAAANNALHNWTGARDNVKIWLKDMYNFTAHRFHGSATFDGTNWVKNGINSYVVTDVVAFAPLEMMFSDAFFGVTQAARDQEVDAMFTAVETSLGFLNGQNPMLFRFSNLQIPNAIQGDYGSVEWSSQMGLAYMRAARIYVSLSNPVKAQMYANKYNALLASISTYFSAPSSLPGSALRVAPYASFYLPKTPAGNVPTGTGYSTANCEAALASINFVFFKIQYNPMRLGGTP